MNKTKSLHNTTSFFHYTKTLRKIKHIPPPANIFCGERVIFMNKAIICTAGNTPALPFARHFLQEQGLTVTDTPAPDVTHLLLPVPSFEPDGRIKGGGILAHILADLPETITVIGGNLQHPSLVGMKTVDLLQDHRYIAENAAITADCALRVMLKELSVVVRGCPVLVIGWGRIGKCLAQLLKAMGAAVTVAARKETDRAMICALGYNAANTLALTNIHTDYRVIFNTVPAPVPDTPQDPACVKIDLASKPGLAGKDVIWARGLPGKVTPETSGMLIADTVLRLVFGKETSA